MIWGRVAFSGSGLSIFGDDFICGGIDHGVDFMIAGFGPIPGIGNVFIAAGMDFVHEQVDLFWIELLAGDAADVVDYVACQGVDLIKVLKISGCEFSGPLVADVEAVMASDFLRQVMGGFADMVPVGAGGCYFPVQACGPGFLLQDGLGEGAAADVT